MLPQLRLFEVEDQRWLPRSVRDGITNYLAWLGTLSAEPYRRFAAVLASVLQNTGDRKVIDLCAGSSGPWKRLLPLLAEHGVDVDVVLTDLYPNVPALSRVASSSQGRMSFVNHPVDAMAVPRSLDGTRVLFNAFHHFKEEDARRILADASTSGQAIAVFEGVERTFASVFACASSLFISLIATPFIRPLSPTQLLLTYALPVVPVCAAWDGIASSFRCYTVAQLLSIARSTVPDYVWHAERYDVPFSPVGATFLVGYPAANAASPQRALQS